MTMKTLLLLGDTNGVGYFLSYEAKMTQEWKTLICLPADLDMTNGWVHTVEEKIKGRSVDMVVIDLFDGAYGNEGVSMRVFKALWDLLPTTHFVLVSSASHHHLSVDRTALVYAYSDLHKTALNLAYKAEGRKLCLVELGYKSDHEKVACSIWKALGEDDAPRFTQIYIHP